MKVSTIARHLVSRGVAPPASDAARFLFLQYEKPLGSAALATATFAALKARLPKAYIAVAASGVTANLLRASPLIDELIVTPHAISDTRKALALVTDGGNERTRVALLALASGIRRRVGLTLKPELFHSGLLFNRDLSNIGNNMRLLAALGLPDDPVEPAIHFTAQDLAKVEAILAEAPAATGPRIAMVVSSSKGHPNEWFDDHWVALSRRLVGRLDAQIVFVGAAGDATQIEGLRQAIGAGTFSAAGRTDVPQLAALLALSDLVVTIDTGGLHVARAVGAPAVVLANAAQPDHWWLPPKTDSRFRVLRHGYVPCALCLKFVCATRECMQESTVDVVQQAVIDHLAAFPPSAEARAQRVAARMSDRSPTLTVF